MHQPRAFFLAPLTAALLALTACTHDGAASKGQPLDIKFQAVDGTHVDLSKMQGKVVLVDFWATWCGPCVGEIPHMKATYDKFHAKGFEIVGISLDQDLARLREFTRAQGMAWPQYFDGKGWGNLISSRYGIRSIPTMWLVDKNGKLADTDARQDLEGKVAKLLGK